MQGLRTLHGSLQGTSASLSEGIIIKGYRYIIANNEVCTGCELRPGMPRMP
ncbi:MAG: hypothetical protein IPI66_15830 [Chitinophagaceae bacterium]|nr:hypothetical protein [Chitinophagaceae bacterium]